MFEQEVEQHGLRRHQPKGLESYQDCGKLMKKETLWGGGVAAAQSSYPWAAVLSRSTQCLPLTTQTDAAPRLSTSNNVACPPTVFVKTAPEVGSAAERCGDPPL